MKLTRRGRRVVGFLSVVGAIAVVGFLAWVPPGWWL